MSRRDLILICVKCGHATTMLEAQMRKFNQFRCACGGNLKGKKK